MLSIGGATPRAARGRGRGGAKEAALAALAEPGGALERGRAAEDHDESDNFASRLVSIASWFFTVR
jgi:hypothetical protein